MKVFLSCQPLAAPQNISPTRISNPIYDPQGMINFSNRGVTSFWFLVKLQTKLESKDSKNKCCILITYRNGHRKIMQPIKTTNGPVTKRRK